MSKKRRRNQTGSDKVPQGRTLTTHDNFLGKKKTSSAKKRPVVVIEANERNELAVVPLSSRSGKNRTKLTRYQQGQSYFKHYVEIEDDEGKPIYPLLILHNHIHCANKYLSLNNTGKSDYQQ